MSRFGAVIVVAFGSLSLACGGEDPSPTEAPPDAPSDEVTDVAADPEWALDFEITGRAAPMTARAELKVTEGERPVHVAITGRAAGDDLVMIDLTFDGLENTLGPHRVEFTLPDGGEHVAISSLDDTWYYSQGGAIDISVEADGSIQGNFDIALATGTLGATGEPLELDPSAVVTPLVGTFSGDWVLNCHSRLMGHQALVAGGDYCEGLAF